MKIFRTRKDDFAEVAADPERRRVSIARLTNSIWRMNLSSFLFLLIAVIEAFRHSLLEAAIPGFASVVFMILAAEMKSDLHLLQVMSLLHDKPSA